MLRAELNLPLKATNSICVQCVNTSTGQKYIHILAPPKSSNMGND